MASQSTGRAEAGGPSSLHPDRLDHRIVIAGSLAHSARPRGRFVPLVRAKALERLPGLLEALGVRFDDILQRIGLPNVPLDRQDGLLPFRDALAVLEEAARQTGLEHLGLRLATAGGFDALGDYGRYISAATTLQQAITRAGQYVSWHSLGSRLSVTREDARVVWHYHLSSTIRHDRRHACLFALAIMRDVVRLAAGTLWLPDGLRLEASPAEHQQELVEAFGERIVWQADTNALVFPEALLACPVVSNRRRQARSDVDAAGLAATTPPPDLVGSLRPLIRSLLPAGYPGVALLARLSGLSLRTFQRELAAAGLSFSDLVDQARLELALALMCDPAMPLTEVALELGYSDSANFTRAFRRWTGLAPRRYRQAALWAAAGTSPMPAGPRAPA